MSADNVLSSYFTRKGETGAGDEVYDEGKNTLIGQVEKVHYIDDPTNRSKQYVEYDVSVRDAYGGQSVFSNLRVAGGASSSTNDFEETILESNTFAFSGKLNPGNIFKNKNGAVVAVSFFNGSLDKPFISDVLDHPRDADSKAAKRADGIRKKGEFRGLAWEVDKDGALTIKYQGNRKPNGELERPDTSNSYIRINKQGWITLFDNEENILQLNRTDKKIKLEQSVGEDTKNIIEMLRVDRKINLKVGGDSGTFKVVQEWDGQAESMTTTFDSGLKVSMDGANDAVKVTTAGGAEVTIDGQNDQVKAVDNSGATLNLEAGKVALGDSSTEVLDKISTALGDISTFATAASTHLHIGNLGFPTAPPLDPSPWLTMVAALTAIKASIDALKGSV